MSVYEKHIIDDTRLPFIFHSYVREKRDVRAGVGNWHENIEILCFTAGSATVTSNELRIEVCAGDIAVINSSCLHEIFAHEETHFFCLIVDREFCLANHLDTNLITFFPRVRNEEIYSLIIEIAEEYQRKNEPYIAQLIRANTLKAVALLCKDHSEYAEKPRSDTKLLSSIKFALGYISNECHRELSLDEIAKRAGLSKYYLAREFHRITGYTIVNYINVVRCEKAKPLLAQGTLSIESIAGACGFPGASYFTKVFKKHIGLLPSEYKSKYIGMG